MQLKLKVDSGPTCYVVECDSPRHNQVTLLYMTIVQGMITQTIIDIVTNIRMGIVVAIVTTISIIILFFFRPRPPFLRHLLFTCEASMYKQNPEFLTYIPLALSTRINIYQPVLTCINPYQPASTRINPYKPVSTHIYLYQPKSTRINTN